MLLPRTLYPGSLSRAGAHWVVNSGFLGPSALAGGYPCKGPLLRIPSQLRQSVSRGFLDANKNDPVSNWFKQDGRRIGA